MFNPQGYSAFAAVTGILAAITDITYCCGLCGFGMTKCDDEESTGQNANSENRLVIGGKVIGWKIKSQNSWPI